MTDKNLEALYEIARMLDMCAENDPPCVAVPRAVGDRWRREEIGRRALALLLKHEWASSEPDGYGGEWPVCPECGAHKYDGVGNDNTHKPGCAWSAIVAEAKKLG